MSSSPFICFFRPIIKGLVNLKWKEAVILIAAFVMALSPSAALAAPQNGQVVKGQAAISQSGKATNI
ncbi:MAG: hypothetical protein LBP22_11920, partial [Deltaproteobacteria bacterium]|nr:hypothetical protein [Deltaproteobacteria bacterium]